MMKMSQVAQALDVSLQGNDVMISGVSKDTRDIQAGELYVALTGEHFNGHQFVAEAKKAGAAGILISENVVQPSGEPQVKVNDTRIALGRLAAVWRQSWGQNNAGRKLIGITGSNGKTTVKEMCRKILHDFSGSEAVLSTRGNLNNEIGVPMMLLELREQHQYAVIEMGANHVGEINYLSSLAKPDVAVVNNVGPAHLEGFGSLSNTATGKAEIFSGLDKDGVAVINQDDAFSASWKACTTNKKTLTFSMLDATADIYAKKISDNRYQIIVSNEQVEKEQATLTLQVLGTHNVMNALAATSITLSLGVSLAAIVASLSVFQNIKGRLTTVNLASGCRLIDDSYNANPASVAAAIDVLAGMPGHRVLVLGDMYELGENAEQLHAETGIKAKKMGINALYATGALSKHTVDAFSGSSETDGFYFNDKKALIKALSENLNSNDVVLVKGSRSAAMEEVVQRIMLLQMNNKVN